MRYARWVVRCLAPPEWRDSLVGDLEEERQRRKAAGSPAGFLWATTAALAAVLELRLEALRGGGTVVRQRGALLAGLGLDVRLAVRALRSSPGFTFLALAMLALGIGAGTAMFAVVNAVVLRPLPFDEPDRLIAIGEVHHRLVARGLSHLGSVAPPNFFDWRESLETVDGLAASSTASGFTIREGNQPEDLRALRVTANLFDVLRVQPTIGRSFTPEHEIDGNDRVALISDGFWRRRFGGDPQVIGHTLRVDSGTWEIIGVMPAGFAYPFGWEQPPDVFVPYARVASAWSRAEGRNYNLQVIGRLKPGVNLEQTASELQSITGVLARDFPEWFVDRTPGVLSLHDATVGRQRGWMLVLLGAVGFVLLMACVNLANLMLARGTARSRESLIRTALGASRWRIARGLLVESLVLTTAGAVCGLLAAWWSVGVVRSALPATLPRNASIQIDAGVVILAAAVAAVVAMVAGLAPALRASTRDPRGALDEAGRSGIGRPRQRVGAVLVIVEVALAVVPLAGAGLFAASFLHVANVDLGLDYRNVLTVSVAPRNTAAADQHLVAGMHAVGEVLDRTRALPGVEAAAALAGGLPFSGSWTSSAITVDGTTFDGPDDPVQIRRVTPDYAKVTRTAVRRGRYLDDADIAGTPLVVVLNEEAVRRFFGERDPIGAVVELGDAPRIVVGVVGDVRVRGPEVPVSPEAYFPLAQMPSARADVLVRTAQEPTHIATDVARIVLAAVPGVPVAPGTLESQLQQMIAQRELHMHLTGLFGLIAVVIAAVGIYGVMAYTVAQQRQEIGVRMALGASPSGVLRMVLGRAALLVGTGLALGSVGSLILAGSIRAFLFEVRPHEPVVFVGVAAVLIATGLLAAFVPARSAARVDPIIAMRQP